MWIKENARDNKDRTIFNSIEAIKKVLPINNGRLKYVSMINFGEYSLNKIPENDFSAVFGFRIVFRKEEWKKALEYCFELKRKGYYIFVQPMMTINYSDKELLELIDAVNKLNPYACYIVDSFGVMKRNDLLRLSYIFDHNLNDNIIMGYHACT